jgi:hypothetical protein
VAVVAALVARDGEAKCCGDRRGGVRGAERVILALAALGETREPLALAQRADAVAAAGENFVRIGLVADIPDDDVARGVEDVVKSYGKFDDAEAGAEVAAGLADRARGCWAPSGPQPLNEGQPSP